MGLFFEDECECCGRTGNSRQVFGRIPVQIWLPGDRNSCPRPRPMRSRVALLLRNARHHQVRSLIASALRKKGWEVEEEISCIATNGSTRRVDILAYSKTTRIGYIIDPTIRYEKNADQSEEVDQEKKIIYEPTIPYFKTKYDLNSLEVIGLLIGARGVIPKFFSNFLKQFDLPKTLLEDIVVIVLKRSCQILSNHLRF